MSPRKLAPWIVVVLVLALAGNLLFVRRDQAAPETPRIVAAVKEAAREEPTPAHPQKEDKNAAAVPAPPLVLTTEDHGASRSFEIALDEAVRRGPEGKDITLRLDPPATLETLSVRLRGLAGAGEVQPVCYEPGKPHLERYRHIITRDITVQLPSADADPLLPPGVVLKERPSYAPGYAIVSAADPFAAIAALEPLRSMPEIVSADIQLASLRQLRAMPNDPLVPNQWHLKFQSQSGAVAGTDVNIENAWLYGGSGGVRGSGVRIGIVDDGLQVNHPDLAPNVDTVNDKDWNGGDDDPSPGSGDDHGTACAGNAAACGNNNLGVSGTAPEATLVGMRLIAASVTDAQEAEAMAYLPDLIPIKTNSWGPNDDGLRLEAPGPLARAALANSAATGRGGLGSIFLWAGGNGLEELDNSNYDGYANDIHTIAIAATDSQGGQSWYSESGANLVVSAPSSGDILGITTVDRTGTSGYNTASSASGGDYTNDFGGTSSATPTAAGIVALMLEKKPGLGWRDVQEILIRSAAKIAPTDPDWSTNSAGFHFNHKFGAGLIDATAAVNMAATWTNLAVPTSQDSSQSGLSVSIPDNNATGISRSFAFSGANLRVEQATLNLSVSHANRGELEVTLTSPSGMVSRLAEKHNDTASDYSSWTFSSVRHWGENSNGTWILKVADRKSGTTGTLTSATLTLYGTPGIPINPGPVVQITSPAAGAVFSPGATVNVAVSASDLNADASPGTVASVQLFDNGSPVSTDNSSPFVFVLNPALGSHSLTAIATDGEGKTTTSGAVGFTVVDQPPVVTSATLTPSSQAFADEAVSVTGIVASDPENQALTYSYAWEKSADSVTWTSAGITTASLPPAPGNAGLLWRCKVTASDSTNTSAAFVTASINILVRPPASSAIGSAFSYDSGLVLRGTDSPVSRNALINEFSQGVSGSSEWVEILTLREGSFRGWKLVDSGNGGQLAFADAAVWDAVPAGTLVVIYNGAAKDSLLPADDVDVSDGRMVLSSDNSTYFAGTWPGYGNSGDAVILRDSANALVAGLSYGTSSIATPHFSSLSSGNAIYYTGSTDAGAADAASWKVTTSQTARSLRAAGDLFISEYVEGSSNNKVIELYNPSASTVNLAMDGYKIEVYANGSSSVNGSPITLAGTVAAGGTFVLKHSSALAGITAQQTSMNLSFNGDDAVVLKKGNTIVDSFGQVGVDPGSAWTAGGVTTMDKTLRRKSTVTTGDTNATDAFNPSLEWDQFNVDDFTGLGSHTIGGGGSGPSVSVSISPASFLESAGASAATGTVTLSAAPAADVVVSLLSSDFTAATVPASVTVLVGQTTATFTVAAIDDADPDGSQTSVISASASGYTGGTFVVTVTDNEPSLDGVTPGGGNTPGNASYIADLRSGALNAPALFRFGAGAQVPSGLSIDATTGIVSGTVGGPASSYLIVIERYNTLGEVVSQSFTLTVTAGGGYSAWIAGFSGLSSTDPTADPDYDGMVNLLEYHLGAQPGTADPASLPVFQKTATTLTLTWWRLKSATDTTGSAQWSDSLGTWQNTGITTQVITDEPTREQVQATLTLQPGDTTKFLRLHVE